MRRYWIALVGLTIAGVLLTFVEKWMRPEGYVRATTFVPLAMAVVTGVQHVLIARSLNRTARRFVQVFLGATVGGLAIYLVILAAYDLTHIREAYRFTVSFLVEFVVFFVFETAAVYRLVEREKRRREGEKR